MMGLSAEQERAQRPQIEARLAEKRRRVAVHESGHAVVARKLGLNVREVTINKDGSGICWVDVPSRNSLDDIRSELKFDLAGRLAVELERGKDVRDDALPAIIGSEARLDWPGRDGMEGYRRSLTELLGNELKAYRWLDDELPVLAAETNAILLEQWGELVDLAKQLERKGSVYPGPEWNRAPNHDGGSLVDRLKRNRKNLTRPTQAQIDECVRFLADKSSDVCDCSYVRATLAEWERTYS